MSNNRHARRTQAKLDRVNGTKQTGQLPARVAICIPSFSQWEADFGMCLAGMVSQSAIAGLRLAIKNEKRSMVSRARNLLVRWALQMEVDWLLYLDADMTYPADLLLRLLSHNKDIVGPTYNRRAPPYDTLGHLIDDNKDLSTGGLRLADSLPAGLLLVKAAVFKKLKYPWFFETYDEDHPFDGPNEASEDVNFVKKAVGAGFEAWMDLDLTWQCGHIGDQLVTCTRPPAPGEAPTMVPLSAVRPPSPTI